MAKLKFSQNESGASAVEFALIAPMMLTLLLGVICFGIYFGTNNSIQELAAQAARASIPGMTTTERGQLASSFVTQNLSSYPLLDPTKLQVSTSYQAYTYTVTLTYDMSSSFIFGFTSLFHMPTPTIKRAAAIQNGGY